MPLGLMEQYQSRLPSDATNTTGCCTPQSPLAKAAPSNETPFARLAVMECHSWLPVVARGASILPVRLGRVEDLRALESLDGFHCELVRQHPERSIIMARDYGLCN
jgi:hypothetical protein